MPKSQSQKNPLKPESFKEYYNYISQNNFINLVSKINFTIDYIIIHYKESVLPFDMAKNLPSNFVNVRRKGNKFWCQAPLNNVVYDVEIKHKYYAKTLTGTLITLRHPSLDLVEVVESLCGNSYTINSIEYSIDIYSSRPAELFRLVSLTSHLHYARVKFDCDYRTSGYLNNPRKTSTRGARYYLKPLDGEVCLRMEMVFKQRVFKDLGIVMLKDACELPAHVIFDYWKFSRFDFRGFLNKLYSKNKVRLSKNEIQERIVRFEREFFCRVCSAEDGGGVNVMRKIVNEYGENVGDYFIEHEFQKDFFTMIDGEKFI